MDQRVRAQRARACQEVLRGPDRPVGLPAVLLPASREQVRKLGERLASSDPISEEDSCALEELVACHMRALELARPRLDGVAESVGTAVLHITHRAKTTQTIIEKLRREHGMSLARVQDLAGIRVVGALSFDDQDRLAQEIMSRFSPDPRAPKISDRRAGPSHGYRALHVIVCLDGVTIEMQIRTFMQHVWADLMERLADRLGRGIRYGQPPGPPPGMSQEAAQNLVNLMMTLAEEWAAKVPAVPREAALSVDRITEDVWTRVSDSLRRGGVDL